MHPLSAQCTSYEAQFGDYCQPKFHFKHAVKAVKAGEDVANVAKRFLQQLSNRERLHLLDGDESFYPGLRNILLDRYNRVPFLHGALPRLGLPGIRFTDGPRGVVMGSSTAFPVPMARGATWDVNLEREVGHVIGIEGKAQGANYFAGVCINLPRHPAWGRIQETYGEDPILLGEFGSALTQGVQKNLMACVKHFALNSMENARFRVDVEVDEDVLHEVYLPHFKQVVETGVASVMSSYNSVNGEFAGQNYELLTQVLRDTWDFQGFVLSDFIFGLRNAALSVKNGLDIEAPFSQQRAMGLGKALASGELSWNDIDEAVTRIIKTQLRFAATQSKHIPDSSVVSSYEHRALARKVAARSMILLKNDPIDSEAPPLLPLSVDDLSRVAVIGRLADTANTGDRGSSHVFSPHVVTPFEGIKAALPGTEVLLEDSSSAEKARHVASLATVAICIVGYDASDEGEFVVPSLQNDPCLAELLPSTTNDVESDTLSIVKGNSTVDEATSGLGVGAGGDRKSLRLSAKDVEVIRATVAGNPRTVVAVVCGGAVITEDWKKEVPSLLICWYSGAEGGHALADVLLGHDDASGRLPFSIPKDESHLPFFDMNACKIKYDRWHGQGLLDKLGVEASFPVGYGLSYTTFKFSNLEIASGQGSPGKESFRLSVTVRNEGTRAGRHVVQVYGRPQIADFPSRVLLGFAPVQLEAGGAQAVQVKASLRPVQRWVNGSFMLPVNELEVEVASHAGDPDLIRGLWVS